MKKLAKKKKMVKASVKKSPKQKKQPAAVSNSVGVMPLGDRVLIQPKTPEEMTSFGLIIPDTAKEKPEQGIVVAVGVGKKNDEGKTVPLSVKVGDRVMFSKYGFDEITVNGVEYFILPESSILAVLQ